MKFVCMIMYARDGLVMIHAHWDHFYHDGRGHGDNVDDDSDE